MYNASQIVLREVLQISHILKSCLLNLLQQVIEIDPSQKGRIRVAMTVTTDPNLEVVKQKESQHVDRYMTGRVN